MTCPFPPWTIGLKLDAVYFDQREKCDLPTCLDHSFHYPILIKISFFLSNSVTYIVFSLPENIGVLSARLAWHSITKI